MIAPEKPPRGDPISYKPVIGNVVTKRRLLDAYVLVPAAHLDRLVAVAATNRPLRLTLVTSPLLKRRALIRSIRLTTDLDED